MCAALAHGVRQIRNGDRMCPRSPPDGSLPPAKRALDAPRGRRLGAAARHGGAGPCAGGGRRRQCDWSGRRRRARRCLLGLSPQALGGSCQALDQRLGLAERGLGREGGAAGCAAARARRARDGRVWRGRLPRSGAGAAWSRRAPAARGRSAAAWAPARALRDERAGQRVTRGALCDDGLLGGLARGALCDQRDLGGLACRDLPVQRLTRGARRRCGLGDDTGELGVATRALREAAPQLGELARSPARAARRAPRRPRAARAACPSASSARLRAALGEDERIAARADLRVARRSAARDRWVRAPSSRSNGTRAVRLLPATEVARWSIPQARSGVAGVAVVARHARRRRSRAPRRLPRRGCA